LALNCGLICEDFILFFEAVLSEWFGVHCKHSATPVSKLNTHEECIFTSK